MNNEKKFMHLALLEAKKAYINNEIPIGAVIVKDNKIIAKAYNKKEKYNSVIAHAEILAIKKASKILKNWRLINCDIYVTLKPCEMCTSAIFQSRIKNIIYATENYNNYYNISNVNNYKINFISFNKKAKMLIRKFFKNKRL